MNIKNYSRSFTNSCHPLQSSIEQERTLVPLLLVTQPCSILQRGQNAVVRWMQTEIFEPQKCVAFAGKDVRDPAERVVEVPESDADAGVDLGASANDLDWGQ